MTELNESEIRKMPFFVTWHTMFLSIYLKYSYALVKKLVHFKKMLEDGSEISTLESTSTRLCVSEF
jgi:hypothetical protein